MPEEPLVEVRVEETACVLTLSRPAKLNALSTRLEGELAAALASEPVRRARVVVVTGAGGNFSAGADVGELRDQDPAAVLAYYRATGEVYEQVARLPQPCVSAIEGWCLGGGLELALATDLRVADESATLGLPEVAIGIVPSSGGLLRAVRALGPARARDLVLRGRRVGAAEALALGLVHEVAPRGQALPRALELAAELAQLSPLALSLAKQGIDAVAEAPRDAALLIERLAYGLLAQTPEAREATAAFVEKREPASPPPPAHA